MCGVYNEGVSFNNLQTVIFGDLRHSQINKIQIAMRACRKHENKPFFRIVLPIVENDFNGKDISELVKTFCKIDGRLKKEIQNKSGGNCNGGNGGSGRVRVNVRDDVENAELLYGEVYDRFGRIVGESNINKKIEELNPDTVSEVKNIINDYRAQKTNPGKTQPTMTMGDKTELVNLVLNKFKEKEKKFDPEKVYEGQPNPTKL